ncbi:hypothetical protein NECAME_11015 [Necator americanus]|uniref:Uncharacterized protein n=1 Tax=Necator americanus TaxID=51031 RepID=W2T626_NECAM|nr:hypothetical protein NECAME_11015 [Necator americanus]ETN77470.1 hypothetical protein NECAME_11015 [Necator americanus]
MHLISMAAVNTALIYVKRMILRLEVVACLLCLLSLSVAYRWKRDFMYVSDVNGTDADCFQILYSLSNFSIY